MEVEAYKEMADTQEHHWWFRAKRDILSECITGFSLPKSSSILEIGCGTGSNIQMLKHHGNLSALEMDDFARKFTEQHSDISVTKGWLPDNLPFERGSFDLVCMFDVLEHVKEDSAALERIKEILKPGAILFVTVPAYQWLFGRHDENLHHHRRYTLTGLKKKFQDAGYEITKQSYFNSVLFPLVALARLLEVITKPKQGVGNEVPPEVINTTLYYLFRLEKYVLPIVGIPFGTSILLTARRTP